MVLAATEIPVATVVILMALGVIIATYGHMAKSRALVVTGLMVMFMATLAMLLGAYIAFEGGGDPDVRPARDPKEPTF